MEQVALLTFTPVVTPSGGEVEGAQIPLALAAYRLSAEMAGLLAQQAQQARSPVAGVAVARQRQALAAVVALSSPCSRHKELINVYLCRHQF